MPKPPIPFPDKAIHAAVAELVFQIDKAAALSNNWGAPTRREYLELPDETKLHYDIPMREAVSKFLRVWL